MWFMRLQCWWQPSSWEHSMFLESSVWWTRFRMSDTEVFVALNVHFSQKCSVNEYTLQNLSLLTKFIPWHNRQLLFGDTPYWTSLSHATSTSSPIPALWTDNENEVKNMWILAKNTYLLSLIVRTRNCTHTVTHPRLSLCSCKCVQL